MRRVKYRRLAALALCIPLSVVASTGCDLIEPEFTFECPQPAHPPVAIAVGARANSPAPQLPLEVRQLIVDAMMGCGQITVIRVDGRPSIVGDIRFSTGARTAQNFELDKERFLNRVTGMIAGATAQVPEANVLAALSLAAAAASPDGTVVLIDSGVQTTDPIDFRQGDLPTREPEAVADALRRQDLLPSLTGRTVILVGLGYTAAPQDALDERNKTFVVDLWREIAAAAGASDISAQQAANTGAAVISDPPVGTVKFPVGVIVLDCDSMSVLPDDGEVGFMPDRAEFRDPAAARRVLRGFAEFLRNNPRATVKIGGYVAHYGTGELSQQRADRVRQELIALGVRNHITATGEGYGPYPDKTAPPDPRYDHLNRQVTISIRCD